MEIGEYGINPDHAENTGTQDDNDRGHKALPKAARSGNGAVHEGGKCVGTAHHGQTCHTGVNHRGLRRKQRKELPPEQDKQQPQGGTDAEGIGQTDEIAFQNTVALPGAEVLPHKTGAGRVKCGHNVVNQRIGIGGG